MSRELKFASTLLIISLIGLILKLILFIVLEVLVRANIDVMINMFQQKIFYIAFIFIELIGPSTALLATVIAFTKIKETKGKKIAIKGCVLLVIFCALILTL